MSSLNYVPKRLFLPLQTVNTFKPEKGYEAIGPSLDGRAGYSTGGVLLRWAYREKWLAISTAEDGIVV